MTSPDAVVPAPSAATGPSGRKRLALITAVIVGVVAVAGVGAWAWRQWFGQGPQAAEALPADTLAYVGVDLDPPGKQKLAAYDTLRRFPSLKKELGLGSQDDLRRAVIEQVGDDNGCDLKVRDIEGWAGDRAALAVVPQKKPELVVVVQVTDGEKAEAGLAKAVAGCPDEMGFAAGEEWAVIARTTEVAEQVLADGGRSPLADDADFRELTRGAGDPGIVTLYAAPEAGPALLEAMEDEPWLAFAISEPIGMTDPIDMLLMFSTIAPFMFDDEVRASGSLPGETPEERRLWKRMEKYDRLTPAEQAKLDEELQALIEKQMSEPDAGGPFSTGVDDSDDTDGETYAMFGTPISDHLRQRLKSFSGAGGVVRFVDGSLEVEVVGDPLVTSGSDRYDGTDARTMVTALPDDVAAAFGGGFRDGWAEDAVQQGTSPWDTDQTPEGAAQAFEEATGLTADDLADLGGERIAFAAGSDFAEAMFSFEATSVPVAARVEGDQDAIEAALEKLRAALGKGSANQLLSERIEGGLLIGTDRAFLDSLVDPADTLAHSARFRAAVPHAEDAMTIAYLDFDAAGLPTDGDDADLAPLSTLGMSVTAEGDQERMVVRLTFDR